MPDSDPSKPGPWTIKGVSYEDREAMNSAASRADMHLGPWIAETARLRIAAERVSRLEAVPADPAAAAPVAAGPGANHAGFAKPTIGELAALLRDLEGVPGCRRVTARARQLLLAELSAHLPAAAPSKALAAPKRPALDAPAPPARKPA